MKINNKYNKRLSEKNGVYFYDIIVKMITILTLTLMTFSHYIFGVYNIDYNLYPLIQYDEVELYRELYDKKFNTSFQSFNSFISYIERYNDDNGPNMWMFHVAANDNFNYEMLKYNESQTVEYLKTRFGISDFIYLNIPNETFRLQGFASPQLRLIITFVPFIENYDEIEYGIYKRYIYIYVLTHEIHHLKLLSGNERYVEFETFKALWEDDKLQKAATIYLSMMRFDNQYIIDDYDVRYYINNYLKDIILNKE